MTVSISTKWFESQIKQALGPMHHARLLVTVSGGADSTALLLALASLECDIVAAHCNFHLRGEESMRDQKFVEGLCHKLDIKLETTDFNVPGSRLPGESDEMTCRRLRYEWFDDLVKKYGCRRIVTGHNADDNIETLLLNLLRGSGVKGLRGMVADTGRVVRPMLSLTRAEITAYLAQHNQPYITDSTNLATDYRRNFLRLEVLPLLESRWPGARTALQRSLRCLAADSAIVDKAVAIALENATDTFLPLSSICSFADPTTLILAYLAPIGATPEIAASIGASASTPSGQRWQLANAWAVMLPDGLHIEREESGTAPELSCTQVEMTPENIARMRRPGPPAELWLPRPLDTYCVRTVKTGDRMAPLGMKGSRLLSDIMREAGIPLPQRKAMRVVEDPRTGQIIWLEGLKRSRHQLVEGPTAWLVTAAEK